MRERQIGRWQIRKIIMQCHRVPFKALGAVRRGQNMQGVSLSVKRQGALADLSEIASPLVDEL